MSSTCPVPLPGIQTVWWFTTSAVKIAACVQQSSERPEMADTLPQLNTETSANMKRLCENSSLTRCRRKRQSGYSALSICLSLTHSFQCNGKDHTSVWCSSSQNYGQWDLIQIYEVHYPKSFYTNCDVLLSPEKRLSSLFPHIPSFLLYLQCTLSFNMTLCPMHLVESKGLCLYAPSRLTGLSFWAGLVGAALLRSVGLRWNQTPDKNLNVAPRTERAALAHLLLWAVRRKDECFL